MRTKEGAEKGIRETWSVLGMKRRLAQRQQRAQSATHPLSPRGQVEPLGGMANASLPLSETGNAAIPSE
jgi:hypothetical protein